MGAYVYKYPTFYKVKAADYDANILVQGNAITDLIAVASNTSTFNEINYDPITNAKTTVTESYENLEYWYDNTLVTDVTTDINVANITWAVTSYATLAVAVAQMEAYKLNIILVDGDFTYSAADPLVIPDFAKVLIKFSTGCTLTIANDKTCFKLGFGAMIGVDTTGNATTESIYFSNTNSTLLMTTHCNKVVFNFNLTAGVDWDSLKYSGSPAVGGYLVNNVAHFCEIGFAGVIDGAGITIVDCPVYLCKNFGNMIISRLADEVSPTFMGTMADDVDTTANTHLVGTYLYTEYGGATKRRYHNFLI